MAPGQPLFFAEELFTKRRFRHIPVVNMHGKPVGIVSDRDILRAYVKGHDQDVRVEPINTIMSKNVLTVFTDTAIRDAARVLFQERIGCLPVVDDQNVIIGLVTRSDILRTIITTVPLELWI
jgi:acetoin utilization protein AcuB